MTEATVSEDILITFHHIVRCLKICPGRTNFQGLKNRNMPFKDKSNTLVTSDRVYLNVVYKNPIATKTEYEKKNQESGERCRIYMKDCSQCPKGVCIPGRKESATHRFS